MESVNLAEKLLGLSGQSGALAQCLARREFSRDVVLVMASEYVVTQRRLESSKPAPARTANAVQNKEDTQSGDSGNHALLPVKLDAKRNSGLAPTQLLYAEVLARVKVNKSQIVSWVFVQLMVLGRNGTTGDLVQGLV